MNEYYVMYRSAKRPISLCSVALIGKTSSFTISFIYIPLFSPVSNVTLMLKAHTKYKLTKKQHNVALNMRYCDKNILSLRK